MQKSIIFHIHTFAKIDVTKPSGVAMGVNVMEYEAEHKSGHYVYGNSPVKNTVSDDAMNGRPTTVKTSLGAESSFWLNTRDLSARLKHIAEAKKAVVKAIAESITDNPKHAVALDNVIAAYSATI